MGKEDKFKALRCDEILVEMYREVREMEEEMLALGDEMDTGLMRLQN